jgi:hypothetical protein
MISPNKGTVGGTYVTAKVAGIGKDTQKVSI